MQPRDFKELWFTVLPKVYADDGVVTFAVYKISRYSEEPFTPSYETADGRDTDLLSEAGVYLHGWVKWDGCSHWHFDEQDRVMLHACSRTELENLGAVLAACWDLAAELMPDFRGRK